VKLSVLIFLEIADEGEGQGTRESSNIIDEIYIIQIARKLSYLKKKEKCFRRKLI